MGETNREKRKQSIVYMLSRDSRCYGCDQKLLRGAIAQLKNKGEEEREVLCQSCAGLAQHRFISAGNAKLTKAAGSLSKNHFVVMKWSDLWKTYERQGLLVEPAAFELLRRDFQLD